VTDAPVDIVNRCATKICAVNLLLNDRLDDPNTNALHLCRETADGLYWMLWEVSEELKYAANRMLLMILNNSFFFRCGKI